jgi:2-keto-4-pentenoate hydratase/2-oxohepta-3-ene-1,7-dioic acid hydratase in catechol pathway
MRIASWSWGGRPHVGTISPSGREATPLAVVDPARGALGLIEALARGEPLPPPAAARLPIEAVELRAPLPRPLRNIFCVGRNYRAHAVELAESVFRASLPVEDAWPIVFSKLPECVIGPHDPVRLPGDVSARDVQVRHQQWDLGKSFDTFCPMGPWITTADEMDGRATRVRGWVNGELRQDGLTKDMIFDLPTLIETCSRGITLYPGDVIATGTPSGVGMGFTPPRWLGSGDVVRIEIDGLGAIENRFQ